MLDKEMLEHNCRTLLEMDSGLSFMINNKKLDDLTRLYQLYSRIPNGIYELKSQLARLILQRVSQINALEKAPVSRADSGSSIGPGPTETRPPSKPEHHLNWVSGMLSAIEEITDIWKRCFAKDRTIQMEMNNSFETGINEHPKSAEYISLFIDENLKRGLKGVC